MRKKFQNFSQKASYWLGVVAVGLIIGLSIQFTVAWVNPPASPPTGNVGAPLTTGAGSQYKMGGGINIYNTGDKEPILPPDSWSGNDSFWGGFGVGSVIEGGTFGVLGVSNTYGSLGALGYAEAGVYSVGSGDNGLSSRDSDNSSWTHLNYKNYGVYTNTPIYTDSYVKAPRIYDNDDTGYYLDPSNASSMKALEMMWSSSTPYIDFKNDTTSDYDMRLMLTGDNELSVTGGNFRALDITTKRINGWQLYYCPVAYPGSYCPDGRQITSSSWAYSACTGQLSVSANCQVGWWGANGTLQVCWFPCTPFTPL
ncbi:MAG: hypothetical protein PHQ20_02555 [Candidatus Moranbacteria bacterium]|nr:hypothetical protein [Candidatus Moranbacteria bacterium]